MTDLCINTFKDLFIFLQNYESKDIYDWLNINWEGKDKQESLLRFFCAFELIFKLKDYRYCKGNYNLNTIEKISNIKDFFYKDNKLINLKDSGDSSDLTCISKSNSKHLLLTTSKNMKKININKLDIDPILTNFSKYKINDYTMTLCICIRDINKFNIMRNNVKKTNITLLNIINNNDLILIDHYDLNEAYHLFKQLYKYIPDLSFKKIINSYIMNKELLKFKMHQELSIIKTLKLKENKEEKILWGHIQRSGKSYIMAGCIIKDSKDKLNCNYLIITTAPNETITQYLNVLSCYQLIDFNLIYLNGQNKNPKLKNKNIIICSKQFLQYKICDTIISKNIPWLKNIDFDIRFIDESHNGGTTILAKKMLEYYGNNSFTIQITATYIKPINDFNIPKKNWILWDLEDINLCKNLNKEENKNKLIEKHGAKMKELLCEYNEEEIIAEYSKYPTLNILTHNINENTLKEIKSKTQFNEYGWSLSACFNLINYKDSNNKIIYEPKFEKEEEVLKIWYKIFGKKDIFGIPDKDYEEDNVFINIIEKMCNKTDKKSRFMEKNEPAIILAFLPQKNIDLISKATTKLLEDNNIIPDYLIISINSNLSNNPKKIIEEAIIKARNSSKKGILVLSGKQCSLGVSIDNCDIVLLLNNTKSYDMIYQMMFRCMTEGKNKRYGFVVDLNLHRTINISIMEYALLINPKLNIKEAIQYMLESKIIKLNGNQWESNFCKNKEDLNILINNMYKYYINDMDGIIKTLLNKLSFDNINLTKEEISSINIMFNKINVNKNNNTGKIKLIFNDKYNDLKTGLIKTQIKTGNIETDTIIDKIQTEAKQIEEAGKNKELNNESLIILRDIFKHIIPLISILTIKFLNTDLIEMFDIIKEDNKLSNIFIEQLKCWLSNKKKTTDLKFIDLYIIFKDIYIKYIMEDDEKISIIKTIKELFINNKNDRKKLSAAIDEYLIPQEFERKINAEISTPFELRQEMLNKIPVDFWKSPKKVLEPCCGKGGFLIDIIDRFMIGLESIILDNNQRYKIIVEDCLYFNDINQINIFICKLLLDQNSEYKLNFNEGDTLKLDIKKKWGLKCFDAIIGNPPYNKNLYKKFTEYCLNKTNNYLLFVIPSTFTIGISHIDFIELLKNNGIKIIYNVNKNIWKSKIDIDTLYFLTEKNYKDSIYINNIKINRCDKILNITNEIQYKLLLKLDTYAKFNLLKGKNITLNFTSKNIETDNIKFIQSDIYKYKLLSRLNGGKGDEIYFTNQIKQESISGPKIIFPRGTASYNSIKKLKNLSTDIVYSKITDEDLYLSTGLVYIKCNNLIEAKIIKWFLMRSKLVRYLFITENKYSELTKGFVNLIPLIDTKNINNDNDIYQYFKLTPEEIKLIEDIFI